MNLDQIRGYSIELNALAKKYGIGKLFIFGSVARGKEKTSSDVDFLVEMQQGASLFGVAGFAFEAERLLGLHVDVVPKSVLTKIKDKKFVQNIQKEALPL